MYMRFLKPSLIQSRSHGIRRNRPITLQITPDSPTLDEPDEIGLQYLASIFKPFDEVFFAIWNGSSRDCNREWLLRLERAVRTALPHSLEVSNEQIANLRVSQLWLQVKLFELSPRFGFLSSDSEHECLTFGYPIVLARDLTVLAMKLPIGSLQIHGVGMASILTPLDYTSLIAATDGENLRHCLRPRRCPPLRLNSSIPNGARPHRLPHPNSSTADKTTRRILQVYPLTIGQGK